MSSKEITQDDSEIRIMPVETHGSCDSSMLRPENLEK